MKSVQGAAAGESPVIVIIQLQQRICAGTLYFSSLSRLFCDQYRSLLSHDIALSHLLDQ